MQLADSHFLKPLRTLTPAPANRARPFDRRSVSCCHHPMPTRSLFHDSSAQPSHHVVCWRKNRSLSSPGGSACTGSRGITAGTPKVTAPRTAIIVLLSSILPTALKRISWAIRKTASGRMNEADPYLARGNVPILFPHHEIVATKSACLRIQRRPALSSFGRRHIGSCVFHAALTRRGDRFGHTNGLCRMTNAGALQRPKNRAEDTARSGRT